MSETDNVGDAVGERDAETDTVVLNVSDGVTVYTLVIVFGGVFTRVPESVAVRVSGIVTVAVGGGLGDADIDVVTVVVVVPLPLPESDSDVVPVVGWQST